MVTDLEVVKRLEKDLKINLKLVKGAQNLIDSQYSCYQIDKNRNVVGLALVSFGLKEFPMKILELKNLTLLNLYNNKISLLPPQIAQLSNLNTLYLNVNKFNRLSAEIGQMKNLTVLELPGNQVRTLPREIGQLKKLIKLSVHGNKLTSLPRELVNLTKLETMYIESNPLKQPPPEIVKQGIEAIFEYLRQLPEERIEEKVVNEAKLILVGQGDVGKTCLAKRLIHDEFIEDPTTEGIDILKWKIKAPTKKREEIKLNVWDFGGQEIYHATHQFFLTKRSIYLLVWNARKSRDYEFIYYWLHTIDSFGGDSPIILVMTKLNERDDDLNMKDLRQKFPQIVGLYKVDSKDSKGISALKEVIKKTAWKLPHMRTPWVTSWFKVREKLEKDKRNWIEYQEFNDFCNSEKLDEKQRNILDEYLHQLGVIVHFRDGSINLKNMVVLKPDWATQAVYKVLDRRSVRKSDGILLHNELSKVWRSKEYPVKVFANLLDLMNEFQLAYELPDAKSHLVTELLPSTEPDFTWNSSSNLRFYYRYDFLPAGVMPRFIVLTHQNLETSNGKKLHWREGVVLHRNGGRAFVKIKPEEKRIEIKIHGNQKREFLAIIRDKFDEINRSINKVKIAQEIPCNCSKNCKKVWNYENLLRLEIKSVDELTCDVTGERTTVSSLLDGYEKKKDRMKKYGSNERIKIDFRPNIEVNPNINVVTKVDIDIDINIKVDLPDLQKEFAKFQMEASKLDENLKEDLKEIEGELLEVTPNSEQGKINRALNKLSSFMQELGDKKTKYNKLITGAKDTFQLAQQVGKTYNKFAQWLALPQVPDLFLGK